MTTEPKPLLSYLLITYNQEKYIREAVESAFAQTYSPLEIIISDDHSTDNTWEIIKELFNKYNGPHKIIINRNKNNLGIAQHINKVFSIANGELFIMAAGDDISLSQRTKVLFENWQKYKNEVFAFTSSMNGIDEYNKPCPITDRLFNNEMTQNGIKDFIYKTKWCGAGTAYDRKLYDVFGNIYYDFNEDRCYLNRAWLLGYSLSIKEPLLQYRYGGISTNITQKSTSRNILWTINSYKQLIIDLKKIPNSIIKNNNFIQKEIYTWQLLYKFVKSKSLKRKFIYLIKLYHYKNNFIKYKLALINLIPDRYKTLQYYYSIILNKITIIIKLLNHSFINYKNGIKELF